MRIPFAFPVDPDYTTDLLHPQHYPALQSNMNRPEPVFGRVKIISEVPTVDHECYAQKYADGRYNMAPNACVLERGTVTNNGPRVFPCDDIRGDISDSEGMDAVNYVFNNTDCGATF